MDEISKLIKKLEEEGKYEEALEHIETADIENLGSIYIKNDKGRIYNKIRGFNEALSCFETVLVMDDSNPEFLFGKGISLIGLNRFDEALEVFNKLTEVDNANANGWYYKSLLSKSLGDSDAEFYFNNFLYFDDEDFRKIRSYYPFGILFDEIEHNFRGLYKLDILNDFKNELYSLNLDDTTYSEVVRIIPLENLFDKIAQLKGLKLEDDTEDIIRKEYIKMGLSNKDVDDLFKIDSVENLKMDIIESCDENPFPDSASYSNFVPLKMASKYNVKPRVVKKHDDLKLFNKGNFFYDYDEIEKSIEAYDEGLKFNPDNLLLKFVKCCAEFKLDGDNNV